MQGRRSISSNKQKEANHLALKALKFQGNKRNNKQINMIKIHLEMKVHTEQCNFLRQFKTHKANPV
jgi:hypothetical protein